MLVRSIRTAIMLLSLVSIAVVAGAVFYSAVREHSELYSRYVESDLNALSDNMANDLIAVLNEPNYFFDLKRYLLSLEPYPNVIGAAVYDPEWNVLEIYAGAALLNQSEFEEVEFSYWDTRQPGMYRQDDHLIAVKRIGEPTLVFGYLVIINDLNGPIRDSRTTLALRILPVALAVMLVLMGLFYFQASRWLWPLTRLSQFARQVQETKDYSLQIRESGKYEVSSLTRDINNMMDAIRLESEINQEYVELLEQRREEMEYLANYDSLTRLVNRQCFMTLLERSIAEIKPQQGDLTVMFVDLDGFKVVNDTLGHEVGDKLLAEVAVRLKKFVPTEDVVSRHGGDEFLVLSHEAPMDMPLLAEQIVKGLSEIFVINNWEIRIGASVGIARASESGYDMHDLIRNADVAMYNAKSMGKSRYSFFNPEMLEGYQRRIDIANAIDQALSNDEFILYSQPKVTSEGQVIGAEALIRWQSHTLGFVSPGEFIPIAEQAGKITAITEWVIEQVCKDVQEYFSKLPQKVPVSVNLSSYDLKKFYFPDFIKSTFDKYEIPTELLEFEVTEHSYLDNLELANSFFRDIALLGCRVALDDFGTGYSSLSYLTKIPIDVIKIDKQFVDDIGASARDDALVLTIIEMARKLGMDLCAEGVETKSQRDFLAVHGCRVMQGYYFARPMTLEKFREYMATQAA